MSLIWIPALVGPFPAGSSLTFVFGLVVLLVLAVVLSLLAGIRRNTRRTAEAVERLADRREGDDSAE